MQETRPFANPQLKVIQDGVRDERGHCVEGAPHAGPGRDIDHIAALQSLESYSRTAVILRHGL
jgi:hypothetical protein